MVNKNQLKSLLDPSRVKVLDKIFDNNNDAEFNYANAKIHVIAVAGDQERLYQIWVNDKEVIKKGSTISVDDFEDSKKYPTDIINNMELVDSYIMRGNLWYTLIDDRGKKFNINSDLLS
jgi:hypothetical protein